MSKKIAMTKAIEFAEKYGHGSLMLCIMQSWIDRLMNEFGLTRMDAVDEVDKFMESNAGVHMGLHHETTCDTERN